jgi:hypothetical protein
MNVGYQITGYDKRTERLAREYDIPAQSVSFVIDAAHVPLKMIEDFSSVPLSPQAVRLIGQRLDQDIDPGSFDWFLEPFSRAPAHSLLPRWRLLPRADQERVVELIEDDREDEAMEVLGMNSVGAIFAHTGGGEAL